MNRHAYHTPVCPAATVPSKRPMRFSSQTPTQRAAKGVQCALMWLTFLHSVYVLCALALVFYTLGQLVLLLGYLRTRHQTYPTPVLPEDTLPHVTVQLPIYNEQYVVKRLLDAVTALDYPRDKLHIQVLDDSTDNTTRLLAHLVVTKQREGFDVRHLHRSDRTGYKAGALAQGLAQTDSDIIAIFDADFVPPPHFLRATVPYLVADTTLGVVQTRWTHLNDGDNWLTQAQRLAVDSHFVIEQTARHRCGLVLPFNGTGGVWRAQAIRDAGGWSDDTLTEDCDLSYRAQLCGWRALYLPDVAVPGELPVQLAAYRQQQARWAQGNTQCFVKHAGKLGRLGWLARWMALQNLGQYIPQLLMLVLWLLLPPLILANVPLRIAPLGLIGIVPPLLYIVSQRALTPKWYQHLLAFPFLVLVGTGLIHSNARAVLLGFWSRGGEFKRTPKFTGAWQHNPYALRRTLPLLGDLAFTLYACWGVAVAWQHNPTVLPYALLHALAFAFVMLWQLLEQWQIAQRRRVVTAAP